jgi:hypothetical protein
VFVAQERISIQKARAKVCKVDTKLGLVFGYAIVCKVRDPKTGSFVDYYDDGSWDEDDEKVYSDHISEEEMLKATSEFMKSARIATEMHAHDENDQPIQAGTVVHSFPLTTDIAKSLGIKAEQTGWLVAMQPEPQQLAKWASGELTQFSIGGGAYRQKAKI